MRTLIYSDVHGNLPAFEYMLKAAGQCDEYICLGDLVNYGPWSNECVDLALSLPNSTYLMGNHEQAFINGYYPGDNLLVKSFFEKCHPSFTRFSEIKAFRDTYSWRGYECIHTVGSQYVYPDTDIRLEHNYMIGHSHHQFVYRSNGHILYNAGSVGQNRKYINVASYLLHDTATGDVAMKSVPYPVAQVIDKMREEAYPQDCINYYLNKSILV